MKRVLVVSIAFPPKSDPESLQVGRYIKYLSQSEYKIEVLTSANPTLYMETDKQLSHLSKDVDKTTEITIFENRYLNFLIRKIKPSLLEYPDSKLFFSLANPKINKPDLIYSRSYPLSSTLMALRFKKKWPDLPWILHLSDPWAISYEGNSPATNFKQSSRRWNQNREMECFNLADKIAFTSDKTINLYIEKYPQFKSKFILTPNVYDDDAINTSPVAFEDKLNIVYTGGFGEKRSPLFILQTIKEFLEENRQIRKHINFFFTGPMTQQNTKYFKSYKQIDEITHLGMIDYEEMIDLQRSAHVLLNIDTNIQDEKHSVFFPSKLLEYMAANRRILAITNSHSVTHKVIQGKFGDCLDFDDLSGLKQKLFHYFKAFESRDKSFFSLERQIDKYSAKQNTNLLLAEMNRLVN